MKGNDTTDDNCGGGGGGCCSEWRVVMEVMEMP